MSDGNNVPTAENIEGDTDGVPVFSLDELNKCRGQSLGGGELGVAYAIDGFPSLVVKEIAIEAHEEKRTELAERELEAIPRLSHPGVLKYHQVIEDGDFFYVVMDRYHGDLQHFIADHKSVKKHIPRELMLSIMRQLADALAYVHAPYKVNERGDVLPGIVHRDLKPANVLMNKDGGRVAIADFRLCKDAQHDGITFAGSPAYMAPEVFIHRKTSPASDIWALGVIIYELATLRLPSFSRKWEPEDAKECFVDGWKPDLSSVKDEFIKSILERIFVLDPEKRPTAKELAELLQEPDIPAIELKAPTNVSDEGHRSLEAALNGVSARLELLESSLRAKTDEIDSLREALANKPAEIGTLESIVAAQAVEMDDLIKGLDAGFAKIGALEQQFTGAIEGLRGAWHQSKLEMDQQRREAARQVKKLKKALKAINNEIASLKKEFKMRSTKIDAPEKQFADTVKNSEKLNRFTPIKDSSWTPLMCAAFIGDLEAAKRHLNEMDERNSDGDTAYTLAARAGQGTILELLDPTDSRGITALMRAAKKNDVEAVKVLIPLQKGQKTNNNDYAWSGRTALMMAASYGHAEVVRLLVEHEGGRQDKSGKTALMRAVQENHPECVKALLQKEAGMTENNGWTALMYAAYRNSTKSAELLLEEEGGMQNNNGRSALMVAVFSNSVDCVRLLLEREGGLRDKDGWSALMHAARNNRLECATLLLRKEGCMQDSDGWTALMCAARNGHAKIVKLLVEKERRMQTNNGDTALIMAAEKGHPECVELLVKHEGGIQDDYGNTALMKAAGNGHADCLKLLLKKETRMKRKNGETALMCAVQGNYPECVKLLLKEELGMQDNDGGTALMWAAYNGHPECVKLLLETEKCMRDKNDLTALIWAASCNEQECVRLLVQDERNTSDWTSLIYAAVRGDVDAVRSNLHESRKKDISGGTALMYAAACGHIEVVGLLIEQEMCLQDRCGRTALMSAVDNDHTECAKLLLKEEMCIKDASGKTALMWAALNGSVECVGLLLEKQGRIQDSCGMTALMHAAESG
ncbi:Serine/threonine-protein kinase NEK [Giardia duodenalis]|uniref:Serine/threonine-protein kinase NEK n=1 Tax=Giardia intestinalis TaxID=5741 RepID=V6TU76_GIAIN|nr:Serine/threonine-protein kinase NEK [Giardia intestinalis]